MHNADKSKRWQVVGVPGSQHGRTSHKGRIEQFDHDRPDNSGCIRHERFRIGLPQLLAPGWHAKDQDLVGSHPRLVPYP